MIRSTRWLTLPTSLAIILAGTLAQPMEASAQRRAGPRPARAAALHAGARQYRSVVYPPFYTHVASPWRYGNWSSWYGWHPYPSWRQPLPWGQPLPYRYYYSAHSSAARLQVEPNEAQVYIDGYFVGIVDDFDGLAQRLRVAPGEREMEIRLDGYRPFRQKVLFRPGSTLRIQQVLQPLGPGEAPAARPAPQPSAGPQTPAPPRTRRGAPGPRRPVPASASDADAGEYGAIAVRVQPRDAEVIVDGERWESPVAGDLTLQLSEGTHHVEVRKEGFRTYAADVGVRRGETTTLNVSLSR